MKIKPLHQILYYKFYIYKLQVSVSYNEAQRARNDLARFSLFESQLGKDEFTIGAFDNFDHSDRSSLSRKFSIHDTVVTLEA